jgi:hypothetical protein
MASLRCQKETQKRLEVAMIVRTANIRCWARACRIFAASVLLVCLTAPWASAGDNWVFRHSYFSHVLPPDVQSKYPVPESRSAYRLPLVDLSPSIAVQGIYRYNTINIYDGAGSYDTTIYGQYWIQAKP